MTDINEAFGAENGFLIEGGTFYTGGAASPVGLDLPVDSIYAQNNGSRVIFWQKFGAGVNDWRIYSAEDISFSSDSGLDSSNVKDAIDESFSKSFSVFGSDFFESSKEASETTTGNSFSVYDSGNFDVSESGSNKYRIRSEFFWGHNSASNDIRVQLLVDGNLIYEFSLEPKDSGANQTNQAAITDYLVDLSQGSHSFTLQYRPASSGRVSRMFRSITEVWRVE